MILTTCFFFSLGFLFFDFFYSLVFLSLSVLFLLLSGIFTFSGSFFFDGISFSFVFLCVMVYVFCIFSSFSDFWGSNFFSSFILFLGGIFFLLVLSFSCFNLMFFYISFEFVFVLMFFFLLSWGYSPERLQASFYMIFYTIVVSFPFLIYLVFLGLPGSGKFLVWGDYELYWWASFFLIFLVKLPVYGVHLWLPKAHVEAPVSGSMVLAGVLLKLGAYGLIRFGGGLLFHISFFKGFLVSLGLLGGLYSGFLCLRQVDFKAFVAYSSVCHMGFGLAGLYGGSLVGFWGGIFMMIGHGFCSSCLFYILFVFYERFSSRSIFVLKGVGFSFPMLSAVWFIFSILNMGVPPFFPFFSEVFIFSGLNGFNLFSFIVGGFLLFFSGLYGIFLYVICCHGKGSLGSFSVFLSIREYLNFFVHFFFLLFFIFSVGFFFF